MMPRATSQESLTTRELLLASNAFNLVLLETGRPRSATHQSQSSEGEAWFLIRIMHPKCDDKCIGGREKSQLLFRARVMPLRFGHFIS